MSELELHKALIKEIKDRANDKYYDTKLIANAVYWILEKMADHKTEPQAENLFTDRDGDVWEWRDNAWYCISGFEQTEGSE